MKKIQKILTALTAAVISSMVTLQCFAEEVGASSGTVANTDTGVQLDWLPAAICLGVLIVAGVIIGICTALNKKKKNK